MTLTRPPLGWNSWNTFASDISEALIRETADKMVETGLLDCGYNYLVIDDCWSLRERDASGRLVPDPEKFPNGMKAVADYVHSKGLKFGMYSCAGTMTCAGYPGSLEHEFIDAATFAEWGVDYLKYDYCYHSQTLPGSVAYTRMGLALANCGRDIVFSACNWGVENVEDWIKTTGAHLWRSTEDILDTWGSLKRLILKQFPLFTKNGAGCFNDMDMLVVGMSGKGHVARDTTLTTEEYRTHFSAWCFFASPLMIGCDIRNMTEETKAILMNREAIAICTDPAARQPFFIDRRETEGAAVSPEAFAMARVLDGGDIAIGMFNLRDDPAYISFNLEALGLSRITGRTLLMRDVWSGEEHKPANEVMADTLAPHTCRLYRARVVPI